jgi:PD-(D/E)XK nuclease superfamily
MAGVVNALHDLVGQMRALQAAGRWTHGPASLVEVLGVDRDEVRLVRLLAWLCTPDGRHGLGGAFLDAFLGRFGVRYDPRKLLEVRTKEPRRGSEALTRVDLVIRTESKTVVIEAKVDADERRKQCDDIARKWSEAVLVFLTVDGCGPTTALKSAPRWTAIAWHEVGSILHVVCERISAGGGCVSSAVWQALAAFTVVDPMHRWETASMTHEMEELFVSIGATS